MPAKTITLDGKQYVILPSEEYEKLAQAARLPELPEPDDDGTVPAVAYARASLARKIIRRRNAAGLSQAELARRAGIRVETLCRIETGRVTPTLNSVEKIDRALREREKLPAKSRRRPRE